MKFLALLLTIIAITNLSGNAFGGENPDERDDSGVSSIEKAITQQDLGKSSLAVLVSCQPDRKDLAGKLEPLLEAEMSLQWAGQLVERAHLNKLLEELKISSSGLTDPKSRLQMSRMLHFDCLLAVKVNTDSVITTVSLFPSTKVIYEKTYSERLEPQSLAVKIATGSIRAIREYSRNPNIPQLSIGSFYYADPHGQYLKLSMDIGNQLRKKLVSNKTVTLTERLLPSDMLKEFDLARGGITKYIARNLSAPPSDILLYGEFQLKPEQDLGNAEAELEFELFIVSPTGLCEDRSIEFSCYSNEPKVVTEKALGLIAEASKEVNTKLASGQKRSFSQKEFQEFKKQAFRLMPSPPGKDGNFYNRGSYRGPSQHASPIELERAFHMLECAMLFKGDDTQVLVCTGAILNGMSHRFIKKYSESSKADFLNASLDIIERAYYLDSNWNTRGMYHRFGISNNLSASHTPAYAIKAAKQIWNTRESELWHKHQIHSALSALLALEKDYEKKCQLFFGAFPKYENDVDGVRILFSLINAFFNANGYVPSTDQQIDLAERLLKEESDCAKAIGHLMYLRVYSNMEKSENRIEYAKGYEKHLLASIDILPILRIKYGTKFKTTMAYLSVHLRKYQRIHKKYSLKNNIFDIIEKYINAQMESDIYTGEDSHLLLYELLPEMWNKGRYSQANKLITQFLENYTWGGSADFERMLLARQRRRFISKIQGKTPFSLDQLDKIEFDDPHANWVPKLVSSKGRIFGICSDSNHYYRNGKVFRLIPEEQRAYIIEKVPGEVRDIACTERLVGVATEKNGFYLVDNHDFNVNHFTPKNSSLPNQRVTLICDSGNEFYIAVPDKENYYTHVYHLDPEKMKISQTNTKFATHRYWRLKANTLKTENSVVIPQTWDRRTFVTNNETLELSCSRTNHAIKDVVIRSDKEGQLMSYKGFELSYVYDFIRWKGMLIFATGNGLYMSKPGSNELQCLICEPDMFFFSLCPFKDGIYIATSEGLFWIDYDTFKGVP